VSSSNCHIIPNCLAKDQSRKIYIGSELSTCSDQSELAFRRPVDKGFVVNWESQKEIWEHEFFSDKKSALYCDPAETGLLLTEAPNALPVLQGNCDQIVFEEFGFKRYYRTVGPSLVGWNDVQSYFKPPPPPPPPQPAPEAGQAAEESTTMEGEVKTETATAPIPPTPAPTRSADICLIIDSGYSHTTITPLLLGKPLQSAVRRLDVGGKLLTNYLTRLISLRQYDMRNEPYLMNDVKEKSCFVSLDFNNDLERAWKHSTKQQREGTEPIAVDYVLPDYTTIKEGYVKPHDDQGHSNKLRKIAQGAAVVPSEEVLTLRNERFTVPEILFHPRDIGLQQPSIAEIVMDSLSVLPVGLWPGLLANIVVVGGNAKIPGFVRRLQEGIRMLAPSECLVRVARPPDPTVAIWEGGANLARNEEALSKLSVTKAEYEEHGAAWVARKFVTVNP
jgi:actin-related protein 6